MDECPRLVLYSRMDDGRFREQLKARMVETGIKVPELARRAGVSREALYKLLQREGASTSAENARKLADALGIEGFGELVSVNSEPGVDTALIPIYDVRASAGAGLIPAEYVPVTHQVSFAMDYIRTVIRADPKRLAIITVAGDSMAPTLQNGDLVMLDMSRSNFDVEGIFVFRHDETIHIKRVIRSARAGHVVAIPDNGRYPQQEFPMDEVTVIGRVVWAGGVV